MSSRKIPPRRAGAAEEVQLFQQLKRGKPGAFDSFYDRYAAFLFALARSITGSEPVAGTVLESAFRKALERTTVRQDEQPLEAWLAATTIAEAFRFLRLRQKESEVQPATPAKRPPGRPSGRRSRGGRRARQSSQPVTRKMANGRWRENADGPRFSSAGGMAEPVADWSAQLTGEVEERARQRLARGSLRLPLTLLPAWYLRDVQGVEPERIGSILDLPVSSVKSRVHWARVLLRQDLSRLETLA